MQNKFQKLATLLLVCVCCAGIFSSCEKDDDDDSVQGSNLVEALQGTWNFQKMKVSVMGQTIEMNADDLKDETGYGAFYDETLTFSGNKVNGAEYEINGNKILLPYYVEQQWWAKVSISGSKLELYYNITEQGVSMQLWTIYTKKGSRSPQQMPADCHTSSLLPGIIDLFGK